MRWLLAAATLIALALAGALVFRTFNKPPEVNAPLPPKRCEDTSRRPVAPLPELRAAPLQLVIDPGVTLRIDGAEPAAALSEGDHLVEATAAGSVTAKLRMTVDAFTPVLLDVRASFGAVTVLLLGARCAECGGAVSNPDLRYRPNALGDLAHLAQALSGGDWLEGARQLHGIAPTEREAPEPTRLLAVLYAFAGRPTLAREQLEHLEEKPLQDALNRLDALDELKPVRQLQTATARWNATTERFQRVTDRFVAEAPKPLTALTSTFGELTNKFVSALENEDAIGCEDALESANASLAEVVMRLRRMHPQDCDWQGRVSDAL